MDAESHLRSVFSIAALLIASEGTVGVSFLPFFSGLYRHLLNFLNVLFYFE